MNNPIKEAVDRAKLLGTCGDGPEDFAEDAAREALQPVRRLHRRSVEAPGECLNCGVWPCDTALLVYADSELRGDR